MVGRSYVVTGGGQGIGRAVVERLLADGHAVVVIELDSPALDWTIGNPAGARLIAVTGSAADETVTERAADLAQAAGTFAGWVNNAAVFRDAALHSAPTREVLDLIALNVEPAVVGSATAIRRFLAAGIARGHCQCILASSAAGGTRGSAIRDGQGCDRRFHSGVSGGLRPARHPGQRCRARVHYHRAIRGVPGRAHPRSGGTRRSGHGPTPSGRTNGESCRSGLGRRLPAVRRGDFHQRGGPSRRWRSVGARAGSGRGLKVCRRAQPCTPALHVAAAG
jgi:NAD(P)-dependent dehydrogenase (short-subunit alcohol dehydrogenase family)